MSWLTLANCGGPAGGAFFTEARSTTNSQRSLWLARAEAVCRCGNKSSKPSLPANFESRSRSRRLFQVAPAKHNPPAHDFARGRRGFAPDCSSPNPWRNRATQRPPSGSGKWRGCCHCLRRRSQSDARMSDATMTAAAAARTSVPPPDNDFFPRRLFGNDLFLQSGGHRDLPELCAQGLLPGAMLAKPARQFRRPVSPAPAPRRFADQRRPPCRAGRAAKCFWLRRDS